MGHERGSAVPSAFSEATRSEESALAGHVEGGRSLIRDVRKRGARDQWPWAIINPLALPARKSRCG